MSQKPLVACCVDGCENTFRANKMQFCQTCYSSIPDPIKSVIGIAARKAGRGESGAKEKLNSAVESAKVIAHSALLNRYPIDEEGNPDDYEAAP